MDELLNSNSFLDDDETVKASPDIVTEIIDNYKTKLLTGGDDPLMHGLSVSSFSNPRHALQK